MAEYPGLWPAGRAAVMRRQRLKIINHTGTGGNLRMVRAAGGMTFIQGFGVEIMPLMRQRHPETFADHHDPLMRAIGFIGAEQIHITAQIADIGKAMRGITDPVHDDRSASSMAHRGDGFYIIYGRYHIGTMRKTHQFDLIIQQLCQIVQLQQPGGGINRPFTHLHAFVGQPAPDTRICLVVLIGHNDRLPGLQPAAHRIGQHIGIDAGGRAKRHLVPGHAQHRGQTAAGLVHFSAAQLRHRIGGIGLHLALGVKPGQPVDHLHARV